ncbi:hypothetical protein [Streptomyces sp. NPDC101249]|uniref:hypothetical protein n=1 Tax=Streptomyces sp. NPDC101249 TaxID=3366140 RepID=UPI0038061267
MDPIQIAPGLTLTEQQYAVAAAGCAARAPDLDQLSWETFAHPTNWWLIPEKDGRLAKAELVLREDPDRTVKINLWFLPDLRDTLPRPHSHPWDFSARILSGGYAETRYTASDGQVSVENVEHGASATNLVGRQVFHEVTALHSHPGGTVTLMTCGPGIRGSWGYLNPDTGRRTPPASDPGFPARLKALNPHQR